VALRVWVDTRGPAVHPATPHLLEHLLIDSRGAPHEDGVLRSLERLGGELNGAVCRYDVTFALVLPLGRLAEGIACAADVLSPRFSREETLRELEVLERERVGTDDRLGALERAQGAVLRRLWAMPPPEAGTRTDLPPDHESLLRYHATRFTGSRTIVAVAGAVDRGQVVRLCEEHFGSLPAGAPPAPAVVPPPLAPLEVLAGSPGGDCGLAVGFRVGDTSPAMEAALTALSLTASTTRDDELRTLLTGGARAADAQPFAVLESPPFPVGYTYASDPRDLPSVLAACLEGVEHQREIAPPLSLIEHVRWLVALEHAQESDTVQTRARRLAMFELIKGGTENVVDVARALAALSPDAVRDAAARAFVPENRTVLAVVPPEHVAAVRRALSPLVRKKPLARRTRAAPPESGPRTRALGSGIRLVAERDPSTSLAAVRVGFRNSGGAYEGRGARGAAAILATTFSVAEGPAPHGGALSVNANEEAIRFEIRCVSDVVDEWIERVAAHLSAPPAELVEQAISLSVARRRAALADPESLSLDLVARAQLGARYHRAPGSETVQDLRALHPGAVLRHFERRVTLDRLYVAAAGGADPDVVTAAVERLGGQLAIRRTGPAVLRSAPPPPKGPVVTSADREVRQTYLALSYRACPAASPDRAALLILDAALAWYGGRIFRSLREGQSLLYDLITAESFGRSSGTYGLTFSCDPSAAEPALAEMARILGEVVRHGLQPDEVERCRAACLGTESTRRADSEARADSYAMELECDLDLAHHRAMQRRLERVTPSEIHRVARRVLDPQNAALAIVGPDASRRAAALARTLFGRAARRAAARP